MQNVTSCLNHPYNQFEKSFNYIHCIFKNCQPDLKVIAPLYYKTVPKASNVLIATVAMDCLHCRKYSMLLCFVAYRLLDGQKKI
jgi:hypothetical protein